jgi:hypothetical protein
MRHRDPPDPATPESDEFARLSAQWSALTRVLQMTAQPSFDLRHVLAAVLEEVTMLTGADGATFYREDGNQFHAVIGHNIADAVLERACTRDHPAERSTVVGRVRCERGIVHIPDVLDDPEYDYVLARQVGVRTALGVPLLRDDVLYGVVLLHKSTLAPFTTGQVELAASFADQAMIAVEATRLTAKLRDRREAQQRTLRELAALREVSAAVSSSLDPNTVLTTIVNHAVRLSGTAAGAITALDSDHVVFSDGVEPELIETLSRHHIRLSARSWPAERGEPIQRADLAAAIRDDPSATGVLRSHTALVEHGYRSLIWIPLYAGDRLMATMTVWRREPDPFVPEVLALMRNFATQSGPAMRNAELYREVEATSVRLANTTRDRDQLYRLSGALQEPLSLREQLGRILNSACQIVGIDRVSFWTLTPDGAAVRSLASAGFTPIEAAAIAGFTAPLEAAGPVLECYRRGVSLLFDEADPLPAEWVQAAPKELVEAGTQHFLFAPLIARGRTVGVIAADNNPSGRPIGAETTELVQFYASHAAAALDNARMFEKIERQRAQLEEASQHKSQFLANMSHELRTPLNAIIGYSEILREEAEDGDREDILPDLARITTAGRHLLELINSVLDLAKIEAGRMDLYLEEVEVANLVADTRALITPLAAANNNNLQISFPAGAATMRTDVTKVRQALFNLLSNACKFTSDGTVSLRVTYTDTDTDTGGGGWITFDITDTGIGLSEDEITGLFEEFSQADASTTRRYGGTGLGLALSRRLCRLMGGEITVDSAPGRGATFTITLPMRVADPDVEDPGTEHGTETAEPQRVTDPDPRQTVLVIDDDPAARELLSRMLDKQGLAVLAASGGPQGLRLARTRQPSVITLDVMMPGMDGWAVLSALKADPATATIPVVLISIVEDATLGYALGAADCLSKPVDRHTLLNTIDRHRVRPGTAHVLIIDHDRTSRQLIHHALVEAGISAVDTHDASSARAAVRHRRPTLIVLDLTLPNDDAFTIIEQLNQHRDWADIPVLVMTAKDLSAAERGRLEDRVAHIVATNTASHDELCHRIRELAMGRGRRAEADNTDG